MRVPHGAVHPVVVLVGAVKQPLDACKLTEEIPRVWAYSISLYVRSILIDWLRIRIVSRFFFLRIFYSHPIFIHIHVPPSCVVFL